MIKCILTVGIPASGKSTWAKAEVAKDPSNWVRINNDEIRSMINGGIFSEGMEKVVTETRNFLTREALRRDKSLIIDNVNSNRRHFETVCKIAQSMNKDIQVFEKIFYCELDELLKRDADRSAKVGEEVVKKFWKLLGGTQFKHYKPRTEVFQKRNRIAETVVGAMPQDSALPKCSIVDLDGTMCDISHRNPYDASNCLLDKPFSHVVELAQLMHQNGYKIFFFSGREDKYKEPTVAWLDKYFGLSYELYMRESGNKEDDALLKERLFNTYVLGQFNCRAWVDDRVKVCRFVHSAGLPLFRCGSPDSDF
jgi:predicted kinase